MLTIPNINYPVSLPGIESTDSVVTSTSGKTDWSSVKWGELGQTKDGR